MSKTELYEKQISSEEIFKGRVVHLFRDEIELPNGAVSIREYVKHPGAVCVLPITAEKEAILVKQYRYAMGRVLTEIPAGKLEVGENPDDCARRELSEETGVSNAKMIYLGEYISTPAIFDEVIHMYLATDLEYGESHTDEDEFLEVVRVPFDELLKDVLAGKIKDGKTQSAVLKAKLLLEL